MTDTLDTAKPARRRRSDARRSIDAIINAARTILSERPDASMEEVAAAAGVTRQTVYAHFPSRDALIAALLHAAGAETAEALRRYLDIGWELIRRNPHLLAPALTGNPPGSNDRHLAGTARLEQIIRRGQRIGDFDRTLSAAWLTAAIIGLFQAAAEQVAAERLTASKAAALLLESTLRLCGAARPPALPLADDNPMTE
jgi:AcrR family transcriptional regulator